MFPDSVIDPRTIQAYLETEYRVHGPSGFTLRVGEASAELLAAHARHQVECSAYLTACNPFSRPTDDAENATRQAALVAAVERMGLVHEAGIGQHPSNEWPGEESVLIHGLSLEAASELATRFEQNGFVWSGPDATPRLILLR